MPRHPLYHEPLRPRFHFTARYWDDYRLNPGQCQEGWINDVNGLMQLDGEYHLFAQRWWACWLHAVSRDLVHWQELPPAFGADETCDGTQSGGGVVDYQNTSGLAIGDAPVMVAFWTARDNRSQCISYSNDRGRTWTKYANNPVLDHPCRDPKVFWHSPTQKWIMILYGPVQEQPDGQKKHFYTLFSSQNLLDWEPLHSLPDLYECPDMFELPIDGDPSRTRWVIVNGDGDYLLGQFDGTRFTPESGKLTGDHGKHFYATMTWGDFPDDPWRRVQIAWMRRWGLELDMPFNQLLTFPCDCSLHDTPDGLRMFRYPIPELATLYEREWSADSIYAGDVAFLEDVTDTELDVELVADLRRSTCDKARLIFQGRSVVLDLAERKVHAQQTDASLEPDQEKVHLRMLVDRLSVETFVDRGRLSFSNVALPVAHMPPIALHTEDGDLHIDSLRIRGIQTMWAGTAARKPL